MSGETLSRDNGILEPILSFGDEVLVRKTDEEMLQNGYEQLALDIVRLVESNNPGMVKDYLGDILTDKNGKSPVSIRMAAFEYLAHEQRGEIRHALISSGSEMLHNLGINNQKAQQQLEESSRKASRSISSILGFHEQEVGRRIRNQLDSRRIAEGHDMASQTASKNFRYFKEHVEKFDQWASAQQQETGRFSERLSKGRAHERALNEASKVVKPDYEGGQKDLSPLIDAPVLEAATTNIQSIIAAAQTSGKSPEKAVIELLSQRQGTDRSTEKLVKELGEFANTYAELAIVGSRKVRSMASDSEDLLKRFVVRGRDGYNCIHRAEEAIELFRMQKKTLVSVAENADLSLRQSEKVFVTGDSELIQMRNMVISARTA